MRRLAVILTAAATVTAGLVAVPASAATLPSPPTTGYAVFTGPLPGPGGAPASRRRPASAAASLRRRAHRAGLRAAGTVERTFLAPPTGQSFAVGTYDINETLHRHPGGGLARGSTGRPSAPPPRRHPHRARGHRRRRRGHRVRRLGAGQLRHRRSRLRSRRRSGGAPRSRNRAHRPGQHLEDRDGHRAGRPVRPPSVTAIGTGTDAKVAITADTCSGQTIAGQHLLHPDPHRHARLLRAGAGPHHAARRWRRAEDPGHRRSGTTPPTARTRRSPRPASSTPAGRRRHDHDADRRQQVHRPAGHHPWGRAVRRTRPRSCSTSPWWRRPAAGLRHPLPDRGDAARSRRR